MSAWLLGTLVATSALAAIVLLIREPVRRSFGSRVAYGLWLIPAARLLMPTLTTVVERPAPTGSGYRLIETQAVGDPLLFTTVAQPSLVERLGGWPGILLTLWLAVAIGLFVSRMLAFHRDRRAILSAGDEVARFGSVRVVRSPEVAAPIAFGVIDRVIAVPAEFDRLYGARERRLALEHELAHHQSGDLVANLIAFVLLCLQWFNPLAWVAHAAFRFDQEAACDARVLDKAKADDRADYGRAIAKAASGRALLFASALDRRKTLHRRLQSMLRSSNSTQRLAGRLLVGGAVAIAVPLTASRAIDYVDVPAPHVAPSSAAGPVIADAKPTVVRAASVALAAAPAEAAHSDHPAVGELSLDRNVVTIDGVTKRWEDLTPAEKARVREAVAKAREGLAKAHFDRDRAMRDVSTAMARIDPEKLQREAANAKANAERALRELDENSANLRRLGHDPEKLKAEIQRSMASMRAIDAEQMKRAMEAARPERMAATFAEAEAAMQKAKAELDQIDARLRAEQQ